MTTQASIAQLMDGMGVAARHAATQIALSSGEQRNAALHCIAASIRRNVDNILTANREDVDAATQMQLTSAMLDRLSLDASRIEAIAVSVEEIAKLADPLGQVSDEWSRPNGLRMQRVSVPLGVIGIIYESRPNVTVDAAALCLKSGNASILRGGSESLRSNAALYECIRSALQESDIDHEAVQLVPTPDRDAVGYLLSSMSKWLDVVIPRGGKSLVARVQEDARVPVIGHLEGICHVYVHASANAQMAREIVLNAKMRRTGICGAAETLLIDEAIAASVLPDIADALHDAGCELRGDAAACELLPRAVAASTGDWSTEYLDAIISIRIVDGIETAMRHIAKYGSAHTECIVAEDAAAAARFCREVDSAIVLHNASTQFADGAEFGMGAEIGIATGRVHVRGPVGAQQLTSYKYIVHGNGQVRSR